MSEELKRYVEDALFKWIRKQIDEGNFKANLRIEIDNPIEIRGMKGRIVGDITLSGETVESMPSYPMELPKKEKEKGEDQEPKKEGVKKGTEEEMSLAEVDRLLRSLGV
jgi:hypothetical protein